MQGVWNLSNLTPLERLPGFDSLVISVEPTDGRIPANAAFQEQAATFRARTISSGDGAEERPPPERCLSSPASTPPMLSVPTLNLHQIVQTPGAVLIQSEWNRDARIVRMNARHNPAALASWLGDSVGWWAGDTLVVETRHFTAASRLRYPAGIYFLVSPATVVTERFTRTAEDELSYEFHGR